MRPNISSTEHDATFRLLFFFFTHTTAKTSTLKPGAGEEQKKKKGVCQNGSQVSFLATGFSLLSPAATLLICFPPEALLIASYSWDYQGCRCFHSNCCTGTGNWSVVGA